MLPPGGESADLTFQRVMTKSTFKCNSILQVLKTVNLFDPTNITCQ